MQVFVIYVIKKVCLKVEVMVLSYEFEIQTLYILRSAPPQSVANTFRAASSKRRDLSILSSNFFFAYGTRPSMKSYEKVIIMFDCVIIVK